MRTLLSVFVLSLIAAPLTRAADSVVMLPGAHAHNDYEHPRPLADALSHGFQSVEADIHLVDGKLLVAHDRDEVEAGKTLESLYLEPLRQRVRQHRGHVYPEAKEPFFLLIDIKTSGESTYRVLHENLKQYQEILTEFQEDKVQRRAVTVIVSGNRPKELLATLQPRLAAYDGRLTDLDDADPNFIPWISDNWRLHFKWNGEGEAPASDKKKLADMVQKAHRNGLQIRLWAIPDHEASWKLMKESGVDFINTDRLPELSAFLRK